MNLIHEAFADGFPELEERFVREKRAADRRYEYNLGSRTFDTEDQGDDGLEHLKNLFRRLDHAVGNLRVDDDDLAAVRRRFTRELRHWGFRKGARKRRQGEGFDGELETMSDCDGPVAVRRREPKARLDDDDDAPLQPGGHSRLALLANTASKRDRAKVAPGIIAPPIWSYHVQASR